MTKTVELPDGWGGDGLAKFLDVSLDNQFASFQGAGNWYRRLRDIVAAFTTLITNLNHTPDWMSGLFVLRAHSAFLGACRLGLSGQVPECFMLLRGTLEAALYGLFIAKHPEHAETWARRHDSEGHRKAVRKQFGTPVLMECLKAADQATHARVAHWYEVTIDLGAHPNAFSIAGHLAVEETGNATGFKLRYLASSDAELLHGLKSCAVIGITALDVFRNVYQARYAIIGLDDRLTTLKTGL